MAVKTDTMKENGEDTGSPPGIESLIRDLYVERKEHEDIWNAFVEEGPKDDAEDAKQRILFVTGAGGAGKTKLAMQMEKRQDEKGQGRKIIPLTLRVHTNPNKDELRLIDSEKVQGKEKHFNWSAVLRCWADGIKASQGRKKPAMPVFEAFYARCFHKGDTQEQLKSSIWNIMLVIIISVTAIIFNNYLLDKSLFIKFAFSLIAIFGVVITAFKIDPFLWLSEWLSGNRRKYKVLGLPLKKYKEANAGSCGEIGEPKAEDHLIEAFLYDLNRWLKKTRKAVNRPILLLVLDIDELPDRKDLRRRLVDGINILLSKELPAHNGGDAKRPKRKAVLLEALDDALKLVVVSKFRRFDKARGAFLSALNNSHSIRMLEDDEARKLVQEAFAKAGYADAKAALEQAGFSSVPEEEAEKIAELMAYGDQEEHQCLALSVAERTTAILEALEALQNGDQPRPDSANARGWVRERLKNRQKESLKRSFLNDEKIMKTACLIDVISGLPPDVNLPSAFINPDEFFKDYEFLCAGTGQHGWPQLKPHLSRLLRENGWHYKKISPELAELFDLTMLSVAVRTQNFKPEVNTTQWIASEKHVKLACTALECLAAPARIQELQNEKGWNKEHTRKGVGQLLYWIVNSYKALVETDKNGQQKAVGPAIRAAIESLFDETAHIAALLIAPEQQAEDEENFGWLALEPVYPALFVFMETYLGSPAAKYMNDRMRIVCEAALERLRFLLNNQQQNIKDNKEEISSICDKMKERLKSTKERIEYPYKIATNYAEHKFNKSEFYKSIKQIKKFTSLSKKNFNIIKDMYNYSKDYEFEETDRKAFMRGFSNINWEQADDELRFQYAHIYCKAATSMASRSNESVRERDACFIAPALECCNNIIKSGQGTTEQYWQLLRRQIRTSFFWAREIARHIGREGPDDASSAIMNGCIDRMTNALDAMAALPVENTSSRLADIIRDWGTIKSMQKAQSVLGEPFETVSSALCRLYPKALIHHWCALQGRTKPDGAAIREAFNAFAANLKPDGQTGDLGQALLAMLCNFNPEAGHIKSGAYLVCRVDDFTPCAITRESKSNISHAVQISIPGVEGWTLKIENNSKNQFLPTKLYHALLNHVPGKNDNDKLREKWKGRYILANCIGIDPEKRQIRGTAKGSEYVARALHLFAPRHENLSEAIKAAKNDEDMWLGGSNSIAVMRLDSAQKTAMVAGKGLITEELTDMLGLHRIILFEQASGIMNEAEGMRWEMHSFLENGFKDYRLLETDTGEIIFIKHANQDGHDHRKNRTMVSFFQKIFRTPAHIYGWVEPQAQKTASEQAVA